MLQLPELMKIGLPIAFFFIDMKTVVERIGDFLKTQRKTKSRFSFLDQDAPSAIPVPKTNFINYLLLATQALIVIEQEADSVYNRPSNLLYNSHIIYPFIQTNN